jgi:hypothetical protein
MTKTLRDELIWLFMISFGLFLFILFFQPFPLELFDFDSRLLFITGFGAISFLLAIGILILLPFALRGKLKPREWTEGPPFILGFLFFALTTTAFGFYIRYVGGARLSFYLMFKIGLVVLLAVTAMAVFFRFRALRWEMQALRETNDMLSSMIGEMEDLRENEELEIGKDNLGRKLNVKLADVLFIRSAENYIELFYLKGDKVEKQMIRETLKNMESRLVQRKRFVRCHRTCIVNTLHIEKLQRNYGVHFLKMKFIEVSLPVSRQYLLQVKEALASMH